MAGGWRVWVMRFSVQLREFRPDGKVANIKTGKALATMARGVNFYHKDDGNHLIILKLSA